MHFYEYKGHTIYPTPRILLDTGHWKIQLTIRFKNNLKIFTHDLQFNTQGEAVFHSISYGKKLIDEGIEFDREVQQTHGK